MSSQRFYLPIPQIFTDQGILAPGWKLYFYQTGTTTPLAVYSDVALTVPLPNPVLTNNEGHLIDGSGNVTNIYFSDASLYKAILKDNNDVTQWTADPCDPFSVSLANLSPRPLFYAGITTGTSIAYNLVANPPFISYSSTDTFELTFHVACGNNPTLIYVTGQSALNLKKYTGQGTKINIASGDLQNQTYIVRNDGVDVVVLNPEQGSFVGSSNFFPANIAPFGWLKLNGSLISRITYANLWNYAQTSGNIAANDGAWTVGEFSPGDGTTTFRIPDSRGYFPRAWADNGSIDSGRLIGSNQMDAFQGHWHVSRPQGGSGASQATQQNQNDNAKTSNCVGDPVTDGVNGTPRTATETRGINIAWLMCIKY